MKGMAVVLWGVVGVHWSCADRIGDLGDLQGEMDRVKIMTTKARTAEEREALDRTLDIDREVYKGKTKTMLKECAGGLEHRQLNFYKIMVGEESDKADKEEGAVP
jgi:hypothetical protein